MPQTLAAPKGWTAPFTMLSSYFAARKILRDFKPDAIFSKGGAVSIPLCFAAKQMHIPIILHESDAVMGRANSVIANWATTVCVGLPQAKGSLLTGNPVRPEITKSTRAEGLRLTNFSGSKPVLLIYGGSQGSQALNEWTIKHLDELVELCNVIHLTGKGKPGASSRSGYYTSPFAFTELPHLYAITTLAISRAGSGTISELAANGIPAILVPLRGLAQDHQYLNARAAQETGGCMVVEQTRIEEELFSTIRVTLDDAKKLRHLKEKMRTLWHPEAAKSIARHVLEATEKHLPS